MPAGLWKSEAHLPLLTRCFKSGGMMGDGEREINDFKIKNKYTKQFAKEKQPKK